jgi:hypothetical protein
MAPPSTLARSVLRLRRALPASMAAVAIIIAAAAGAGELDAAPTSLGPRLVVEPPIVTAGLFYHGKTVRVSGTVPAGHEVAIVISGKDTLVDLKLKGKVGGVLWSNVGDVTIEDVPSLYLVATSPGLRRFLDANVIESASIGYRAVESKCRLSPARGAEEDQRIFGEFVRLKEKQKLFGVTESGVALAAGSSGDLDCAADFFIPPDVPVGNFDVQLLAFDRYGETALASAVLTVVKVGPAATISAMARERGLLYGVLSVIVALLAGVLAGVVFGHRSKGGH